MNKLTLALMMALAPSLALAKLPALDDAAKAKAAEAAAKAAWQGKVDGFQLCNAQDRAAAHYRKTAGAAEPGAKAAAEVKPGKEAKASKEAKPAKAAASNCPDPGPFAYTPPEQKPQEAAGAPSPAATSSGSPSTKTPAAEKKS